MPTVDALPKDPAWFLGPQILLVPTFLVLLLYFAFGRRSELGLHALQNTAATILVWALNIVAAILFRNDINAAVQSVYDSLHIPTLPPDFWQDHIWIGLIVAVLAKDSCDYMIHRLMHTRWLWPAHAAHHSEHACECLLELPGAFLRTGTDGDELPVRPVLAAICRITCH